MKTPSPPGQPPNGQIQDCRAPTTEPEPTVPEPKTPKTSASHRSEIEHLGQRLASLDDHLPRLPEAKNLSASQLKELAAAIHDLADQQRTLRRHFEELLETMDTSSSNGPTGDRAQDQPSKTRPDRAKHGPAMTASLSRRSARWLLRNTLGRARAIWGAADPHQPPPLNLLNHDQPAKSVKPLQLLPASAALTPNASSLADQTLSPRWTPEQSKTASHLAFRLLDDSTFGTDILRTTWELLAWTLASEDLAFLELRLPKGKRILLRSMKHSQGIGKKISFPLEAASRSLDPRLSPDFRPSEHLQYFLPKKGRRPRQHSIGALDASHVQALEKSSHRLLLLDTSLTSGVAEWCAGQLLRHDGPDRWVIVTRSPNHELASRRLSSFEALGAHCYPLGDFLAPFALDSALDILTHRFRITEVTRLGSGPMPKTDQVRWNSVGSDEDTDDNQTSHRLGNWDLLQPPLLTTQRPEPGQAQVEKRSVSPRPLTSLRQDLQLTEDQILVCQVCDFDRDHRPEDFLGLAHKMRQDSRFAFLLIGQGPAGPTLGDLETYLKLPHFHRLSEAPRSEWIPSVDLVVSTAETLPLPYELIAAIDADIPVVAAEAPGLEQLLDTVENGFTVRIGDLEAFVSHLEELASMGPHAAHLPAAQSPD